MNDHFSEADLFGEISKSALVKSVLRERFIMPPFSVLSARDGEWQERKRKWLALGIKSEVGRGGAMTNASDRAMELAGGFRPEHGKSFEAIPGGAGVNSVYRGGRMGQSNGQ